MILPVSQSGCPGRGDSWSNTLILKPSGPRVWSSVVPTMSNCPTVYKFFDILEELVKEFNIPIKNIYNMDEKGVQLGVGKWVAATSGKCILIPAKLR